MVLRSWANITKVHCVSFDADGMEYYYEVFKCCEGCIVNAMCLKYAGKDKYSRLLNDLSVVVIKRPCKEWYSIKASNKVRKIKIFHI